MRFNFQNVCKKVTGKKNTEKPGNKNIGKKAPFFKMSLEIRSQESKF